MTNQTNIPILLTEHQAAEILNIKATTLRRWRWEGKGPSFRKIGASVRYAPADLENYINAAARQNTSKGTAA